MNRVNLYAQKIERTDCARMKNERTNFERTNFERMKNERSI